MDATLSAGALGPLIELIGGRRVAVLTGAGCSTESGIPDYRGPASQGRVRTPIQHRAFVSDPGARQRYWARSAVGWQRFSTVEPNAAHRALATMTLTGLITQNVDRLHHRAGSRDVIELHGALAEVRCLVCQAIEARDALQARILADNPRFETSAELAPDGDTELEPPEDFAVPACRACGGVLKPDVVFFGDNVPRPRVEAAFAMTDAADVLLVVGSSLTVYSGYRFVLRAVERGQRVAIVNLGPTRGDPHAHVRVDARAGAVLPALAAAIGSAG